MQACCLADLCHAVPCCAPPSQCHPPAPAPPPPPPFSSPLCPPERLFPFLPAGFLLLVLSPVGQGGPNPPPEEAPGNLAGTKKTPPNLTLTENILPSPPSPPPQGSNIQRLSGDLPVVITHDHLSPPQQVPQVVRLQHQPPPSLAPRPHQRPSVPRPTQIVRITSPSNFSSTLKTTSPAPTVPPTTPRTVITLLSNSVEDVEVVYPSNSFQEEEPSTATEQTSFSSFPSRESISGPNPEDFPIISLIDQGHNYYDEVFHLGTPLSQSSVVNPYYSPEEFRYNQV